MRYINVSIKFYYFNVENKIKYFNNFKYKIDCEYIYYFVGSEIIIYKKIFIVFIVEFKFFIM